MKVVFHPHEVKYSIKVNREVTRLITLVFQIEKKFLCYTFGIVFKLRIPHMKWGIAFPQMTSF